MKKKIAVIGSGISGISVAYFLSNKFDVHVYEKNDQLGGHTRTVYVKEDNNVPIDTGFIVFNKKNYPDLIKFFDLLGTRYADSDMSFAVSSLISKIEYSGKIFFTLFNNYKNIFSYKYLKMIFEIYKLYKLCSTVELENNQKDISINKFLELHGFSLYVRRYHIYPLISSIWSSKKNDVENFPLISFINFFRNHGLFNLKKRPKWQYVLGGSKTYIDKIINLKQFKYTTNFKIKYIKRSNQFIQIIDDNEKKYKFDKIILATHADQALDLLHKPTNNEINILSHFKYSKNLAILHSDKRLMPNKKTLWSS